MGHGLTKKEHEDYLKLNTFKIQQLQDSESCTLCVNDDYDSVKHVILTDKLVHEIIQSEEEPFCIKGKSVDCKIKNGYESLVDWIDKDRYKEIHSIFPIHIFNPHVELFIRNFNAHFDGKVGYSFRLINPPENQDEALIQKVKLLNDFVDLIRAKANSKEFKQIISNYRRSPNKNYKSLVDYIDNLFLQHSSLLVLRVDLGYKRTESGSLMNEEKIYEKYEQIKKDRVNLFNKIRKNARFKPMLGHVWKLEHAREKGFHYHMMFFFNGAEVQQDINLAEEIGEYWVNTIAKDRGLYYNCNANKNIYERIKSLGVGMINRGDTESIENLKKAALYFSKSDYFIRMPTKINGKKIKTFCRADEC